MAQPAGVWDWPSTASGLSSSNFLLDGLENNNYLITGPLVVLAPEAIQEYRISTNNFSAEYGRTSGFLANAITRSGPASFTASVISTSKNDALNAANFQDNLKGAPRAPDKEVQPGYVVGGPILREPAVFLERVRIFPQPQPAGALSTLLSQRRTS